MLKAFSKQQHRLAAVATVGITALIWCGSMVTVARAAGADSAERLPKVVAKVNGEPVRRHDVLAVLEESDSVEGSPVADRVAAAIDRAVEQELIAQQAAKDGGTEDPEYVRQREWTRARIRRMETSIRSMMVSQYEKTIPELVEARQLAADVTDEEIDAYVDANADSFGRFTGDRRRQIATKRLRTARGREAYREWLSARLRKERILVNGKRIRSRSVAAAVDWYAGLMEPPQERVERRALLDEVTEMIVAQAAKKQGVDADSIASDTEAVERYLAAAEIGVAGKTVVLGDTGYMPDLTGPARSDQALIWVIRDPALAGEARAAGMENDSVIAAEIVQLQQVKAAAGNSDTDAFFMRIGLSPADLTVTAAERDEWYRAIGRGRSANNDLQTWLQRSKTAWMRTGYAKAQGAGAGFDAARDTTVTAAELDEWYLTIGRTQMGGRSAENDFQTWLQRTKIAWIRAGYVKALRASAKIEMLIE
jgi:hypothetical protein